MKKNSLESLFLPQSIAIVGASNKKGKIGTVVAENILKLGYKGKVFLVNPSYKFLKFKKCYPTLSAIGSQVDTAIVSVPAKLVYDVVKDGAKNVKNFVIISAGFSETGQEGTEREKKLLELAEKNKINILGPNCLGFIIPGVKLNASFAGGMTEAGNIAFVSQSGALAVALMDKAKGEHLKFSSIISVGNKMQIDEAGLLEHLANDKETKVIGMYLEGIKDGARFLEAAKNVSRKKPIVILKAGKTAKAQQAISSHTGALAGSDEITSVAFESAGVIRANDLEEFFNLLGLISFTNAPQNEKVAVITNAGGAGVLTTDAFKGKNINLAEFEEKIKENLKKNLPSESSVENPIDLLGDAREDRYQNALENIKNSAGSIVAVLTPQEQTPVEKIAETLINFKKDCKASVLTVFIGGERTEKAIINLKQNNIANFSDPDQAIEALDKYYQWSVFAKKEKQSAEKTISEERKSEVGKIIANAKSKNKKVLLFNEASSVMQKYGINCVESYAVLPKAGAPEVKNYPVVVKIDSDTVLHKSDKQALILNIKNKEDLEVAIKKLQANFPDEQLIVQAMQDRQTEIILGIKKDEIFGPVIVYGLGGIYTEVFKMVDFLIPPMSVEEIKASILKGKIGFLFQGARGQRAYDAEEFAKIIKGLMDFALENAEIKEFDINPMFIYNDKRRATAADIKIIF